MGIRFRSRMRAAVVTVAMSLVAVAPAWGQKGKKEEPPREPSHALGYSLALLAAGAALFVVGRPHARVRETYPDTGSRV